MSDGRLPAGVFLGRGALPAQREGAVMSGEGKSVRYAETGEAVLDAFQAAESNSAYRALAEHFPNGAVLLYDHDLRYLVADGAGLAEAGLDPDEMVGQTIFEIFEPPLAAFLAEHYRAALAGEERSFTCDFRDRTYRIHAVPVRDRDGAVVAGMAMTQEMTEQVRTLNALCESERRYRHLVESISEGVLLLDREWRCRLVNEAALRLLRRSRERVLDAHLEELLPGLGETPFGEAYRRAMQQRVAETVTDRYAFPGEEKRWYEVHVYPVPEGILVIVDDVSERKEAEEAYARQRDHLEELVERRTRALRRSESYFRRIFDASPLGIVILGPEERIRHTNGALARFLREDRQELIDRPWRELLAGPEEDDDEEDAAASPRRGETRELLLRRADGEPAWARVSSTHVRDPGSDTLHRLVMVEDIDRHKQNERERETLLARLRQSQKMEAVGQLAAGVAHDFNNRLGVIFGNIYLLRMHCRDDEKALGYIDTLLSASRQAADITERLLSFSRQDQSARVAVDLAETIREVALLLNHSIDKRIRVETDLQADPAVVRGDPTALQNALFNLAVNAADAMGDGGRLTFTTEVTPCPQEVEGDEADGAAAGSGPCLRLGVIDTGAGIPEEIRPHIFEPFFTTKAVGEGTGLGLAAVHDTVLHHGGTIEVESRVGEGTRFLLYLPLAEEAPAPERTAPAAEVSAGGHILLVDDEEDILNVLAVSLREAGYEITTCTDGEEGLEAFRAAPERYDLVLLDLMLPRLNGKDLLREIQKLRPDVQVLVTSGYCSQERIEEVRRLGADGFLKKPYDIDALLRRLAELRSG
jgi:PAS domain S-box-containing protein